MRIFASLAIVATLSACSSNPLSKLTMLSDVTVEEDAVSVALSDDLTDNYSAATIDNAGAEKVGGRGGGKAGMAQAGGSNVEGADAISMLLIVGVMTVHSFAEGIGVGVSWGDGSAFGSLISTAIAIHNIPEGLAISLVLIPRGTSVWKAAGWSIFSSLPQPIMAVPAFLFVLAFRPFLPVGLGLAAGAMIWMVFKELLPEALDDMPASTVYSTMTLAVIGMLAFQFLVG